MYKFKIVIFITILGSLIIACQEERVLINNDIAHFSEFPVEEKLSFVDIFEYKEGLPRDLRVVDSTLVICNRQKGSQYLLHNYSLNSGLLLKKDLRVGKGPGEALGAFNFGIVGSDFWVHDIMTKKILFKSIYNVLDENDFSSFKEFELTDFFYKISFIDSLRFYGVGHLQSTYKINEIDMKSNNEVNRFGMFSTLPEKMPIDAVKDAYLSYIYSRPSGGKLVLPYRYTDIFEIYDQKEQIWLAIQGPHFFDVDFEVRTTSRGNNYMQKTKKTKRAYINGAVTEKYIYLIYSGNTRDNDWTSSKFIFVFDWNGKPIKKIYLDRSISKLTVSKDDKTIYSYDENNGCIIKANIN